MRLHLDVVMVRPMQLQIRRGFRRFHRHQSIGIKSVQPQRRLSVRGSVVFNLSIIFILAAKAVAQPEPIQVTRLSLRQAIAVTLSPTTAPASLGSAHADVDIAQHAVTSAKAATSLHAVADIDVRSVRIDLRALGLNIPSYPLTNPVQYVGTNGPYAVLDPRIKAIKTLIDKSAKKNVMSAEAGVQEAESALQEERERIAAETARVYFGVLRTSEQVDMETRNAALAETMRRYAEERYTQQLAAASEVRQATIGANHALQKVSSVRLEQTRAVMRLLFLLGQKMGDVLELSDSFAEHPTTITLEDAIAEALRHNPQLATLQLHDQELTLKDAAIGARKLPTLSIDGDFGMNIVGPDPNPVAAVSHSFTYNATVELKVPVLDGHLRAVERADIVAQLDKQHLRERELRRQIELDTRLAFAALQEATEQLDLAKKSLEEANQDLEETNTRRATQTASGMDLQQAETRRAAAEDDRLSALYAQAQARLSLAEAMGNVSSLDW
jgi:outer membrane protein TolC